MGDDHPFSHQVIIGLAALVLLAGLATVAVRSSQGAFSNTYTLRATFDRTGHNLDSSSSVKIRGVTVGNVASIRLLPDGRSDVAMHIKHGVRVPVDTAASVEPLSIFGPQFLQLEPGPGSSNGPFLQPGGRITKTTPPTELTDILAKVGPLLGAVDPQDLLTVVHTLANGLDGLGPQIGQTVDSASTLVALADRQSANTRQLLNDLATLSSALSGKGSEVAATAAGLNVVLPDIASHPDQLGQLLDDASRLSSDLAGLVNDHAAALGQTLNGLLTTVGAIYQQLASLPGFLHSINGFFYTLGAALLRLPGPDGHIIGVLEGTEPANLCQILVGLACPAPKPAGG